MFRQAIRRAARRQIIPTRFNSTSQTAAQEPIKHNPHREFYKGFGRPVAFNFLIALATFQLIHWSWLKLESIEIKADTSKEMSALEEEVKTLTARKAASK